MIFSPWIRRCRHLMHEVGQTIHPSWVDRPYNLQIDTHNICNLKCLYCNVREGASFGIERGRMEDKTLWYVIKYWCKHGIKTIEPYVNGEPMLDDRLPQIFENTMKWSQGKTINIVDTNGSNYRFRERLVHPNARIVRFTISANTPETYRKVHGRDLFMNALKTFHWFVANKHPGQDARLHFIVNRFNVHEVEGFIERFRGFNIRLFPIHRMKGFQKDSDSVVPEEGFWSTNLRPVIVHPNGKQVVHQLKRYETCQGCWSFNVDWRGNIIHCTDAPPQFQYGHVLEVDMMGAWQKRLRRLDHPACVACTVKKPEWRQTLTRYLGAKAE